MPDDWDIDVNLNTLDAIALAERRLAEQSQEHARQEARRVANRGYLEYPKIEEPDLGMLFPHHMATPEQIGRGYWHHTSDWTANKLQYVCHNCGAIGYKYNISELFRCYTCRSRDITVCRAGEISKVLRELRGQVGVNMQDIYQQRRERLRQRRSTRNSDEWS